MTSPGSYFSDPQERRLAEAIWKAAPGYSLRGFHSVLKLPWVSEQVVRSCGMAIEMRHTANLNQRLPLAGMNARQVANVEHFFCGAALGNVMGPFGLVGGLALTTVYDGLISPGSKLARFVRGQGNFDTLWRGVQNDLRQLTGSNQAGVRFGAIWCQRYF